MQLVHFLEATLVLSKVHNCMLATCTLFVSHPAARRQLVHFSEATLVVSKEDFLALLSAAQRGDKWKTDAVKTAPLIDSIDVFVPAEFNRSFLLLEEYR
ncbi:hypothetical protein DUNSADRAFT_17818 [Dunaliella salina]|uniref:Encoded protein n=1 Tax=Dunaliella salina TaxID=3046 RepID=A0ABQ7GZP8_DUNSA|nr:hypothetical protein DUNSADRAFT_17818 [Dunaliella salina]|eukprot:KAF5840083.1 hypothetical protein DUNSADRAFT_17818 [Dunaliella salina]